MRHHEGSIAPGVIDDNFANNRTPVPPLTVVGLVVILTGFAAISAAGESSAKPSAANQSPLSTELAVLERDLASGAYRAGLATMTPTGLEAEWQRVATADNYLVFAEQHGGMAKIARDSALKAAYDHRRQVA